VISFTHKHNAQFYEHNSLMHSVHILQFGMDLKVSPQLPFLRLVCEYNIKKLLVKQHEV